MLIDAQIRLTRFSFVGVFLQNFSGHFFLLLQVMKTINMLLDIEGSNRICAFVYSKSAAVEMFMKSTLIDSYRI